MVGWHHQLDGHEFKQAPGVGDGQEAWRAAVHGVTKSQTQLETNRTNCNRIIILLCKTVRTVQAKADKVFRRVSLI